MLTVEEAAEICSKNVKNAMVSVRETKRYFLFELEGGDEYSPYISVDKYTGKCDVYSIANHLDDYFSD